MKKLSIILAAMIISFVSCQKEAAIQDTLFEESGNDDLIEVTFDFDSEGTVNAAPGDSVSTKVITEGLSRKWEEGDAIGVFAGDDNVNVKFTLVSGAGTNKGSFRGKLKALSSKVTLYAYYPYSADNTDKTKILPKYSEQVYNGNYAENGTYPDFGKYAYIGAYLENFELTKDGDWPSSKSLSTYNVTGLVRFALKSGISGDLHLKNISLNTPAYNLNYFEWLNLVTQKPEEQGTFTLDLGLVEGQNDYVTIKNGETKYALMVVSESYFTSSGTNLRLTLAGDANYRNVKFVITKQVKAKNDFKINVRRNVSLSLNDPEYSNHVKILQKGNTFEVPLFDNRDSDYEAGDIFWGDDSSEVYHGGRTHKYSDSGEHSVNVNAWSSSAITFNNLENIKAIDFTNL